MAPGSTFVEGGYIARMVPLERLQSVAVLPPGRAPGEFAGRMEANDSPYQRLVLEAAGAAGTELIAIEFPMKAEAEKALAQIVAMLRAFLPLEDGRTDRRVRRLPVVEIWMPQGAEADRLEGLGGFVPAPVARRLEQRLAESVKDSGEEVLVSALVPALADFKTPARLVALTRQRLIVVDDAVVSRRATGGSAEQVSGYELTSITSAQLRYSLLGSGLSLFVPQGDGRTQQVSLPFNSPAIAWFHPLFTRLRLLLCGPYRLG
jgi:hypothetical protein